jgi:pyridoxamine 5'-phosphate oxidase
MAPLLPDDIAPDPMRALCAWIDEARGTAQPQATAMTLATAAADGRPSARLVFVRAWGPAGIEWITDGGSRKARELMARPEAAGVFFWAGLARQVRVEGPVHLLPTDEVDAHMRRRRPAARAAARAWRQGEAIDSRADMNRREGTFVEAGPECGFDAYGVTTAMALADLDNDGDLDLFVGRYVGWTPALDHEVNRIPRVERRHG